MIAAVLLACAVTLLVAAVGLLSPLERRLRDEELETLAAVAVSARPRLSDLSQSDLHPNSRRLRALVRSLRRRADAEAVILDPSGHVLAATDVDQGQRYDDAARAFRTAGTVRTVATSADGQQARVALAVRTRGGREVAVAMRKSLKEVQAAVGVVRRAFAFAALIAFAIAVLLGVGLTARIVRRLQALRDTALRVARIGPGAEVTSDTARDEVGDLTRAFATMQLRLREQEQARKTFVATASHELRTPLTSLQLSLEMLREDLEADGSDVEAATLRAERSEVQVRRLGRLADELLDLSRIDAGVPLRREPVELWAVSRSVLAEFEPRRLAGGASVELASAGACWALADPGGVAQIVRILVDNALRFAPPATRVRVTCDADSDAASVAVSDDGPGVHAADRERIFERFERGGETGDHGGFGLGLAIGRELARRMGGDLGLRDARSGACFALALPAAPGVDAATG